MLIIFDLDDTLIDSWNYSFPFRVNLIAKKLHEEGLSQSEEEIYKGIMEQNSTSANGIGAIKNYLKTLQIDLELEKLAIKTLVEPVEGQVKIPLIDGAQKIVEAVKEKNTLAIVTHGNEKEQKRKFLDSGLDEKSFAKVVVTPGYDKGPAYSNLCEELEFSPTNSLVIGDKYKTDLFPAKKLGMKTVHLKWGRGKILVPKEGEVDYIISSLEELKQIVEELQ